jgi:hypothetical protein
MRFVHKAVETRKVLSGISFGLLLSACGGGDVSDDLRRSPLATDTAITAPPKYDRDDLYRFFAIAFGAAPGVTYMGQLVEAGESGMSMKAIVNAFTTKVQFKETYPDALTNQEYAQRLVDNVVGSSATSASKSEAVRDIVEALKLPGWTRGDITYVIFNNLAKKPANDPQWAGTARKMANQVAYAKHFTEFMKVDTTDLVTLRSVVKQINEATAITGDLTGAIQSFIGTVDLGGSTPSVSLGACAANPIAGTYSMVVETTVAGLGSVTVPTVCINNIATKPASQDSFCGDASVKQALPAGLLTIESCSYDTAAAKGTIAAKITSPITISYTVTYTFVKR